MLSEETIPNNERRRSLTFAEKFEVKFFFKAEAPREVAFCETSFTTGSESYYDDDDYWEDSYDEEEDYYYDENQEYDDYYGYNGYEGYDTNEYDDYYQYDGYDYYHDNVNFSIHYEMDRSNNHYNDYDDGEEEIRGRGCRELFGGFREEEETNEEKASEKSNTRRLALAKLEKGLFRRQQLRDSESYSETEESEASNSNSESDPFDEPLPPTTGKDFLNELKRTNSPVTIKATFTTRDMPISIPISNHNAYKVRGHDIKSSSLTIIDSEENPFSSLDDTLLSCTPLTLINKSPLVVNITTTDSEPVKDLLKSSSLSSKTSSTNSSFDVKYIPSLNSNDLVKTISSNNLLPNTAKTNSNITNLLSSIHNNTNSKGVNNKGVKKRMRSYSSPSSLQQLLPCY